MSENPYSNTIKYFEDLIPLSDWSEPSLTILNENMITDASHDESHILRVTKNALWFADEEKETYDKDILIPACLLHDLVNVPKAAPSEQTIKQAEELVEKLGIEPALHRRFARLEEVDCFWKPTVSQKEESNVGGVFSKIKPKNDSAVVKPYEYETSEKKITWEKFVENVLPTTLSMRLLTVPHGGYCALTTQTNADAPPIFYWDREEKRYPISAYVYSGGSPAHMWGLEPTTFVDVTGITKIPGHDEAYVLIMKDCVDKNTNQGIGLFPENMRSEFHGVRSVIEAYSRSEQLSGREEASACGYQIAGQNFNVRVEVTTSEGVRKYHIDRKD